MKFNRPPSLSSRGRRIVVAGGGTGGHLFPGIAIADAFRERDSRNEIRFISVGKAFEIEALHRSGYRLETVPSYGLKGFSLIRKLQSLFKLPAGVAIAAGCLFRFQPDLVFGVGGYTSGPACLAAWLMRIPVVLHEQNRHMGISNRILAPLARRCYLSFRSDISTRISEKYLHTGNPIRKEFMPEIGSDFEDDSVADRLFSILVCGGSQGAHAVNRAVLDALEFLPEGFPVRFIHQTGTVDEDAVRNVYREKGIPAEVGSFFYDMASRYRSADLLICRAGATTIAEITALGRAAILIPFPYAADNHQWLNAQKLSENNAAEVIAEKDLDGRILAGRIRFLWENPDRVKDMALRSRRMGKPDAAREIVNDCYRLFQWESNCLVHDG